MATTIAAMKGKFGSTDYFILAMKAKELVEKAIIPSEIEGWENMSLEEREQRDINYTRVKNQIAPYLASDADRFFGAIIMMARGLNPENFEPISKFSKDGLPRLYEDPSELMGFLTLSGEEVLIPLDGQHRLKAMQFAIEGRDEKGKPISAFSPNLDLPQDDVTVMLVPYDDKKARKIFTKVNRYAKPTTTGQNLVTDDDDIIAVLSRQIANDQTIIGANLVKYKSNTLSDNEPYFTTLATLAECNDAILKANFPEKIDRTRPVEGPKQTLYSNKVQQVWAFLVENIDRFSNMLVDKDESGNDKRREIRQDYLLGKPVPQFCLVDAFARLTAPETNLSYESAATKLNSVDWSKTAAEWDRVFMSGGKLLTKNKRLVADLLYYRAGGKMSEEKKSELLKKYREQFPENERDTKAKELPPLL